MSQEARNNPYIHDDVIRIEEHRAFNSDSIGSRGSRGSRGSGGRISRGHSGHMEKDIVDTGLQSPTVNKMDRRVRQRGMSLADEVEFIILI